MINKMKYILYYILLYYITMISVLLLVIRKNLKISNLLFLIMLFMYCIAIIFFIVGILNDFNFISVDNETINYLDELDINIEIPEIIYEPILDRKIIQSNNVWFNFLNLFNENNVHYTIKSELQNIYYINNKGFANYAQPDLVDINESYNKVSYHNKQVLFFIGSFFDILNDLENIQKDISSKL